MSRLFFLQTLFIFIGISACDSNDPKELEESEVIPNNSDYIEEICIDPGFEKEQEQRTALNELVNSEINLAEMKTEIGFLSMGWSIRSSYLPELNEGHQQYNYGAVGGLIRKPQINITPSAKELKAAAYKFISIITHKPWTTKEEKYYSTNNETIIGFETCVNYEHLNEFNLVGETEDDISAMYGLPDLIENDCFAYKEDQKVLVLHFNDEQVDWLKFYQLNNETFLSKDYPTDLFKWTAK